MVSIDVPHRRHALYYSRRCDRCLDVIAHIVNDSRLADLFSFTCTDDMRLIPNIVRTVPLIFTSHREILADEAVHAFVENMRFAPPTPRATTPVRGVRAITF